MLKINKTFIKRWLIASLLFFVIYSFALLTGYYGWSAEPSLQLQDYIHQCIKDPFQMFGLPLIAGAIFSIIFLRKKGFIDNNSNHKN